MVFKWKNMPRGSSLCFLRLWQNHLHQTHFLHSGAFSSSVQECVCLKFATFLNAPREGCKIVPILRWKGNLFKFAISQQQKNRIKKNNSTANLKSIQIGEPHHQRIPSKSKKKKHRRMIFITPYRVPHTKKAVSLHSVSFISPSERNFPFSSRRNNNEK